MAASVDEDRVAGVVEVLPEGVTVDLVLAVDAVETDPEELGAVVAVNVDEDWGKAVDDEDDIVTVVEPLAVVLEETVTDVVDETVTEVVVDGGTVEVEVEVVDDELAGAEAELVRVVVVDTVDKVLDDVELELELGEVEVLLATVVVLVVEAGGGGGGASASSSSDDTDSFPSDSPLGESPSLALEEFGG